LVSPDPDPNQALDLRDEVDWTGGTRVQSDSSEGAAARGCWHCVDAISALLALSTRASFARVHALFAEPLQASPQVLLTGLLQGGAAAGSPDETPMQQELLEALFPLFLGGDSPGSAALLQRLWALQPAAIMRAMAQLHAAQPQSLLRVLDLAQSFGALKEALQLPYFSFTLDLATVAQRKDLIQLEPWLQERLRSDTAEYDFVRACLGYLREKLLGAQASSSMPSPSP
jgi:CCR4-NOT transcription complex subunit 1